MHSEVIHEEQLNSSMSSYARSAVKPSDVIRGFLSGLNSSFIKRGWIMRSDTFLKMSFPHISVKWFDPRIYGNMCNFKGEGFLKSENVCQDVLRFKMSPT